MLRSLGSQGIKHTLSTPSLRTAACRGTAPVVQPPTRTLVSTVLLTADGYESKQVGELRALLRQRGLTTAGRKAELVQRLKQSDMARAGSTLANADADADASAGASASAKATASTDKARRPRSTTKSANDAEAPRRRSKKGAEAVRESEKETPAMKIEPGTVVSATTVVKGDAPHVAPPEVAEPPASTIRPGKPMDSHKFDKVAVAQEQPFQIKIPFEQEPAPEPQYIPLIKSYADPSYDYSDTFRPDWHIPHVPRVHAVSQTSHVSHNASISDAEKLGTPAPLKKGVVLDMMSDVLPPRMQRELERTWEDVQAAARDVVRDMATEAAHALPVDHSVRSSPSNARPSSRRPLHEHERRGLWVLGGIVATGFALGGLASTRETQGPVPARAAEARRALYQPPVYAHGGGIVGGVQRKV